MTFKQRRPNPQAVVNRDDLAIHVLGFSDNAVQPGRSRCLRAGGCRNRCHSRLAHRAIRLESAGAASLTDLFGLIERVDLDHTEVEITSKRGSAVLMSKDEFDSLVETSYLLRSPENARQLLSALERARAGEVAEHELHDT